ARAAGRRVVRALVEPGCAAGRDAGRARGAATGLRAAALADLLRFLLPARCLGCASPLALDGADRVICPACLAALREPPWPRCPRCHFPRGTGRVDPGCLECKVWPSAVTAARTAAVLEPPAAA